MAFPELSKLWWLEILKPQHDHPSKAESYITTKVHGDGRQQPYLNQLWCFLKLIPVYCFFSS